MSIIHLNQIKTHIDSLFKNKIDLSDLSGQNEVNNDIYISRALAAYTVKYLSHCSVEDASLSITDGSNDNGIDAIHYDSKDKRLYIVQSKWIKSGKGEPSLGDIKKYLGGIIDLFNFRFDKFNNKVNSKKDIILKAINNPNSKYSLVISYTGINDLASPSSSDINDLLNDLNDANEVVDAIIFKQSDLHNSLTIGLSGEPINLDITITSWGKIEDPYLAYYGQISAVQISEWWKKYHTRLFAKNLRSILGDTEINNEIKQTVFNNPELFWYFNNGLTLISNSIRKTMAHGRNTDIGNFHCEGVSIVNGAQTVGTLGRYSMETFVDLDKIQIPFRIISLEDSKPNFGKRVTRTNNRQNRIENRDFVALDPEQNRIKTELAIDKILYQVVRSDNFESSDKSFDLVESTVALACSSGSGSIVVQLKREIGKLWEDIDRPPYKRLFNRSIPGIYVWRCVLIQRQIDNEILNLQNKFSDKEIGILIHGNRLIAALVFKQLHPQNFKNPNFEFNLNEFKKRIGVLTGQYAKSLFEAVGSQFHGAIIPTLFKNLKKCEILLSTCKASKNASNPQGKSKQLAFDLFDDHLED